DEKREHPRLEVDRRELPHPASKGTRRAGGLAPSRPTCEKRGSGISRHSKGARMATFIMLTRLTADGVKTLKNNPARVQEVNKEVEQLGAKVVNQWATLGQYDFISVVEAPDEKTMAKVSVELGSRGTTSNQTLTAISAEDLTGSL